MNFKKSGETFVLVLEPGEEIIQSLEDFCLRQKIFAGHFCGIGSANSVCMATFDVGEKKYVDRAFFGQLEITALLGNIALKEKKPFVHAHITVGDTEYRAFAGHLKSAIVSAACEIFITKVSAKLEREFSKTTGLNLLKI